LRIRGRGEKVTKNISEKGRVAEFNGDLLGKQGENQDRYTGKKFRSRGRALA